MNSTLIFQFLYVNVINYCYFHTDCSTFFKNKNVGKINKKLSYCWETVRRESMPRIAEIDVEMTT